MWWISYYANGKRIRESSGTEDRKLAETLLKEREGRVATGQPILLRADKTRYEEARDDLLTYYAVYGKRDVAEAKGRLAHLALDEVRHQQLTLEVLRAALDWCTSGQPAGGARILGYEPNARAVRFGLERTYRALARLTPDEARRIELVDLANAVRPRTLT